MPSLVGPTSRYPAPRSRGHVSGARVVMSRRAWSRHSPRSHVTGTLVPLAVTASAQGDRVMILSHVSGHGHVLFHGHGHGHGYGHGHGHGSRKAGTRGTGRVQATKTSYLHPRDASKSVPGHVVE
eukprot:196950-Rhodomonas_salina.2